MAQPMLNINASKSSVKATPNLLPCRVHHDGPVESVQTFWTPSTSEDGSKTAYFRGRKMHGKTLRLPEGYRGVIAEKRAPSGAEPAARRPDDDDEPEVVDLEQESEADLGSLEVQAEFDEMVIWGHEATADAGADPYVRGVEEWLALAEEIHSYEPKCSGPGH